MAKALARFSLVSAVAIAWAGVGLADHKKDVQTSIDMAIEYLKRSYGALDGGNSGPGMAGAGLGGPGGHAGGHEEGPAAMAGIAMIEAGVKLDDPAIQAIAKIVRAAAIVQDKTYQLSLDIIFLDKLGEDIDQMLIQQAGIRLMQGQTRNFGWSYHCPALTPEEKDRLNGLLNGATLKGGQPLPTQGSEPSNRPKLDSGMERLINREGIVPVRNQGDTDDNSNTQFAIIALWSARKHGVPVDKALQLTETRFRRMQTRERGWSYTGGGVLFATPTMTCSGLLALSIVSGINSERSMRSKGTINPDGTFKIDNSKEVSKAGPDPRQDPAVKGGLAYLEQVVRANGNKQPPANNNNGGFGGPGGGPMGGFGGPAGGPPGGGPNGFGPVELREDFYFLWSLERVCVVLGIKEIAGKDWHTWGAEYLIKSQGRDGSWHGRPPPGRTATGGVIDTAWGLMFMSRSNLVKDLTKLLDRSMKGGTAKDIKPSETKPGVTLKPNEKPPLKDNNPTTTVSQSGALRDALVKAGAGKQIAIIKEYEATKGAQYTVALAEAIPQLTGGAQSDARDALANRMARLKANTLESYLENPDPEMRRAAALGVYMGDEKTLIPKVIALLGDEAEIVWRAARLALKELSGKDYGPKPGDSLAQRKRAVADWEAWHKTQK